MTATAQALPQPGRRPWKLDLTHTSVEFSAKHLMITTVKGRIGDVKGRSKSTRRIRENQGRSRRSRRRASTRELISATSTFAPLIS